MNKTGNTGHVYNRRRYEVGRKRRLQDVRGIKVILESSPGTQGIRVLVLRCTYHVIS